MQPRLIISNFSLILTTHTNVTLRHLMKLRCILFLLLISAAEDASWAQTLAPPARRSAVRRQLTHAQADSVEKLLPSLKPLQQATAFARLAATYRVSHPQRAKQYIRQGLALQTDYPDSILHQVLYHQWAVMLSQASKADSAQLLGRRALRIAASARDTMAIADIRTDLANMYLTDAPAKTGEPPQANAERANEMLRKDQKVKAAERRNQWLAIALASVAVGFVVAVFIFSTRARRKETAKNVEIERQLKEIQQKNEQLAEVQRKLTETQNQLIHSEKMASIGQFTAGIAHEINNPINFVINGVEGLKKAILNGLLEDPQVKEVISNGSPALRESVEDIETLTKVIQQGASRTSRIVRGLMNVSRKGTAGFELTDLHELIDSTLLLLQHEISDRIIITKDYGDIPMVSCNAGEINQVFLNILANALQAIPGAGTISIRTYDAGNNRVGIAFTDSGPGIPPEIKSKVFDPFFTTKDVGKGTGLGLSVTHNIIQNHKGTITVDSTPGRGATFTVILPIREPAM